MVISKREKVTKHGFCKIVRGKFGLPGSLSVIQVLNFNFNLIVTQVIKWILYSCILDVRHRNVGKWVSRPRSRYSLFKFKWEGRLFEDGRSFEWIRYLICIGFLHVLSWSYPKNYWSDRLSWETLVVSKVFDTDTYILMGRVSAFSWEDSRGKFCLNPTFLGDLLH